MVGYPFQKFIDLVNFDQKIRTVELEIEKIENEIVHLNAQEESLVKELEGTKNTVVELRKMVDTQELEMKTLDQQERDKKRRLEEISNYKEYQSVKIEIERLQQEQLQQENVVLDAWDKLETAQRELEKKKLEHDELMQKIHTTVKEKQEKAAALQADLKESNEKRPEKEVNVPEEWLEKYTIMRARVTDPVVTIVQNSCSACFAAVTDQNVISAKRGALVQCKGCYRLLYAPEAMEKTE